MNVTPKTQIVAAYRRCIAAGIEHDQALRAVAQALAADYETIKAVIDEANKEPANA